MIRLRLHRFSIAALVAALALFIVSFAASLLLDDTHVRSVTVLTAKQEAKPLRSLMAFMSRHNGVNCEPMRQTAGASSRYTARVLSVAAAACETRGSGPDSIVGLRFRSDQDLGAWAYDHASYVAIVGNVHACEGEMPAVGSWSRGGSTLDGRLYCEPSPSKGGGLAWTDTAEKSAFFISSSSASVSTLLGWWRRYIQGRPEPESGAIDDIRKAFRGYLRAGGLKGCQETSGPLADAALECGRVATANAKGGYVDHVDVFHFESGRALDTFFDEYKVAYRAPTKPLAGYCYSRALNVGTYATAGISDAGNIFCYPDDRGQHILYTIDRRNLAVLISRDDGSVKGAYMAFRWFPG
jgi:hypothetical protein